jgi:mono/diheme cytochrome c family protein
LQRINDWNMIVAMPESKNSRWKLLAAAAALLFPALPATDAHIVTTNVTWNREVARIVYSRCATCHHAGGSAFSLMSYQEAYPWAAAIKGDVLQQKMPPWGAVKGFGDFRNDEALTPDERDLIQIWVDGGAPEGNPNELPIHVDVPDLPTIPAKQQPGEIVASGADYKLAHSLKLDGFWAQNFPSGVSAKITLEFPDGRIAPLVWFYEYTAQLNHPFLLKSPRDLPAGTVIHGLPGGASLALLPAGSQH